MTAIRVQFNYKHRVVDCYNSIQKDAQSGTKDDLSLIILIFQQSCSVLWKTGQEAGVYYLPPTRRRSHRGSKKLITI
jgi:hypothetical protein